MLSPHSEQRHFEHAIATLDVDHHHRARCQKRLLPRGSIANETMVTGEGSAAAAWLPGSVHKRMQLQHQFVAHHFG